MQGSYPVPIKEKKPLCRFLIGIKALRFLSFDMFLDDSDTAAPLRRFLSQNKKEGQKAIEIYMLCHYHSTLCPLEPQGNLYKISLVLDPDFCYIPIPSCSSFLPVSFIYFNTAVSSPSPSIFSISLSSRFRSLSVSAWL